MAFVKDRAGRTLFLSLLVVMMLGLGAPAAKAALVNATGGKSELKVSIATVGALAQDHVYQLILPPATIVYSFAPIATFPITGGTVEDTTMLGTVTHSGGIRTVKCATTCDAGYDASLDATDLQIVNGNSLAANTQGLIPSPIGDLVNPQHYTSPDGTIHYEADVQLNAGAALILNVYFSTNVFVSGMLLGHLTSTIETPTTYHHRTPQSAPSLDLSLVPVFQPCGTPNASHPPPLSTSSCVPPLPTPGQVAHIGPQSVGSVHFHAVAADPEEGSPPDMSIMANLTDVRTAAGDDYNPNPSGSDVTLVNRIRLTDLANSPSGQEPGTATDLDMAVPLDCSSTADPAIGATCGANTTANAVLPGLVVNNAKGVLQAFRPRLNDSGANGVRGDADDAIFAMSGIFVP
jgi:hypothetical protein